MDYNNQPFDGPPEGVPLPVSPQYGLTLRRKPEVRFGVIGYLVGMLMLIFVGSVLQYRYGMAGLAMSELMFLALAVLCANVFGFDLSDTFPLHRPAKRQIGGTVVLWMGFWGLTMSLTLFLLALFPVQLNGTDTSIADFVSSVPFPTRLFVMAVMPAICEEALFRGFILRTMRRLPRWPRILIVGLLFGIMHLDPIRIPITAVLGFSLAIVMIKTENLLLPMLLHFIHNSVSALSTLAYSSLLPTAAAMSGAAEAADILNEPLALVTAACVLGIGAPFLILSGNILLEPPRPHVRGRFADKTAHFIVATTATGIFATVLVISILAL